MAVVSRQSSPHFTCVPSHRACDSSPLCSPSLHINPDKIGEQSLGGGERTVEVCLSPIARLSRALTPSAKDSAISILESRHNYFLFLSLDLSYYYFS
jgi:hypothetical protein